MVIRRSAWSSWRAVAGRTAPWTLVAALLCFGVHAAENWKAVNGQALKAMFAGAEYGDDVHYAYRFRSDGTFSGTEMAKDVRGTWRVKGDDLCWRWTHPAGAEECYRAERNGAAIRLLKNGSEAWYGTLKPGR